MPSYQSGAVIFLDILGTRQRTGFHDKYRIHRLFHEEIQHNIERQAQSPHVIYQRDLRSFSDCAYITYTYKEGIEESRKDNLSLLYTCLYNTSLSILRILNQGFLVRGGATLGECFLDELGFFGPAIECAYFLESKRALFPRVIIEDQVGTELFSWERSLEMNAGILLMFKSIPRLILQDEDGRYYLNVFYEVEKTESMQIGTDTITLESIKGKIFKTIDRDMEHEEDQRIVEKLNWMRGFTEKSENKVNGDAIHWSNSFVLGD